MPRESLHDLQPAYFALVMATEIVATACHLERLTRTAQVLTVAGVVAFLLLAALTLLRLFFFPRAFLNDFGDHVRGPGFFTIVAATAVLGSNLKTIFALPTPALAL